MKYLLLLLVVLAVWWAWRRPAAPKAKGKPAARPPERMLACAHCGVVQPESECLRAGEAAYCCEAHRRAGPAPQR